MAKGDLSFQDQLEIHLNDLATKKLAISLLSGDQYAIEQGDSVTFLQSFVVIVFANKDGEVFFPFEAICNVEVEYLSEKNQHARHRTP